MLLLSKEFSKNLTPPEKAMVFVALSISHQVKSNHWVTRRTGFLTEIETKATGLENASLCQREDILQLQHRLFFEWLNLRQVDPENAMEIVYDSLLYPGDIYCCECSDTLNDSLNECKVNSMRKFCSENLAGACRCVSDVFGASIESSKSPIKVDLSISSSLSPSAFPTIRDLSSSSTLDQPQPSIDIVCSPLPPLIDHRRMIITSRIITLRSAFSSHC
uniref:Uncharacterized protein n=1 Tax=Glossina pallidipes TaxID=7398 RepID=A0A1A9ZY79_GLOPL